MPARARYLHFPSLVQCALSLALFEECYINKLHWHGPNFTQPLTTPEATGRKGKANVCASDAYGIIFARWDEQRRPVALVLNSR